MSQRLRELDLTAAHLRKLSVTSQEPQGPAEILIDLADSPGPVVASGVRRSSSIRSTTSSSARSPLADFQSDNVLNRPSLKPRHLSPFPSPPVSAGLNDSRFAWDQTPNVSNGARTPTYSGGYNPFAAPGLDRWTRETWASRKVALISGITGQGAFPGTSAYRLLPSS